MGRTDGSGGLQKGREVSSHPSFLVLGPLQPAQKGEPLLGGASTHQAVPDSPFPVDGQRHTVELHGARGLVEALSGLSFLWCTVPSLYPRGSKHTVGSQRAEVSL